MMLRPVASNDLADPLALHWDDVPGLGSLKGYYKGY